MSAVTLVLAAVLSTAAFQKQIDDASAAGGGVVRIPRGDWVSGQLHLRSGVTLELEKGARLLGSTDIADYGRTEPRCALIYAEGQRDIAIRGEGVIDGRGGRFDRSRLRPFLVQLDSCTNVLVEGVSLRAGGAWTFHPRRCDGVTVRKVDLWSHVNHCNDGMDISSSNVLIEDCTVFSEDDAMVFKAKEPDMVVENVTVRNCRISSSCNFIKIGTETHGVIRNVKVENCELVPPDQHARWDWRTDTPGVTEYFVGLCGICVQCVDGGVVEDVTMRGIRGTGMQTPFMLRLGRRHENRRRGASADYGPPALRNVLVEDVRLTAASTIACSLTGVPGLRPRDIIFRNCTFAMKSGGTCDDVAAEVPEVETRDPDHRMYNAMPLPAWGFYLRHADFVRFEQVTFRRGAGTEMRPAVFADDAGFSLSADSKIQGNDGPYPDVLRATPELLTALAREKEAAARKGYGRLYAPLRTVGETRAPLLVLGAVKAEDVVPSMLDFPRRLGWHVLIPAAQDAVGVLKSLDAVDCDYDRDRLYLKADRSSLAAEILALAPERFAAVTVCEPAKGGADLTKVKGTAVDLATGVRHPKVREAFAAYNELAKPENRLSQKEIDDAVERHVVPPGREWKSQDDDFFPPLRTVFFRIDDGDIRLTVCDTEGVSTWMPAIKYLQGRRRGAGEPALHRCGDFGGAFTTRSFVKTWTDEVYPAIRPGDRVVIRFFRETGTDPWSEYKNNLRRYVNDVRYRGAFPILLAFTDESSPYAEATAALAAEMDVPCLDRAGIESHLKRRSN